MANAALDALTAAGITHRVVQHEHVTSLAEAAVQAGVDTADVIKTIVVRRADDDFVFVLVPGDRAISWPKLRAVLGVNRLSMPDAATAKDATGYERGTITPFGATTAWPVVADQRIAGRTVRSVPARATPPSYSPRTMPYGSWTPPSPTSPIRRRPDARPPAQSGSSRPQVHGHRGSARRHTGQDGLRCHPSRRSPPPELISTRIGCPA